MVKVESNMKRILFIILAALFVNTSLFAQKPERDFPYYYYNKNEKTFSDYADHLNGRRETIRENDNCTVLMFNDGSGYYIWIQYESAPSEINIKYTLKLYQDIAKNLDKRLDEKNRRDVNTWFIFTDSEENLICAATYCEP